MMPQSNLVFEKATQIHMVSAEASTLYVEKQAVLVHRVGELMQSAPKLSELIGDSSLEAVFGQHRLHARFMSNVLRFNHYRLMAHIIVWEYRSFHARGFSFEYFLKAMHYWQQAIHENLKPKEADEISQVYQWMIDHHGYFVELAEAEDYILFPVATNNADLEKSILSLMLHGDYHACSAIAEEVVKSPAELAEFYLQVLQPCMVEIGNLWESGAISAAQEHLATAIVHRMTARLYTQQVMSNPSKGKAIITASENELHDVGARFVADMLEMNGWQVAYLGANTPRNDLLHMIRDVQPDLLGLSVVMPFNLVDASLAIADIRKDGELHKTRIMVGGPAFLFAPDLWRQIGADGIAMDGGAAVTLADRWWDERQLNG